MFKRVSFNVIIGLISSFFIDLSGFFVFNQYLDIVFLAGLLLLIIGGFQYLDLKRLFDFQKYAFKKVGSKMPGIGRFLFNGNGRYGQYEEELTGEKEDVPSDYFDYLDRFAKAKKPLLVYSNLISSIILIGFSILFSLI